MICILSYFVILRVKYLWVRLERFTYFGVGGGAHRSGDRLYFIRNIYLSLQSKFILPLPSRVALSLTFTLPPGTLVCGAANAVAAVRSSSVTLFMGCVNGIRQFKYFASSSGPAHDEQEAYQQALVEFCGSESFK